MSTAPETQPDDRAARIAALKARRAAAASGTGSRRHPARGARVVALLTSVAATGGVGAALYRAEQTTTVDAAAVGDALTNTDTAIAAGGTDGATTATVASSAGGSAITAAATATAASTATASTATAEQRYADGTYLGAAQSTRWGDVQVQVTISSGRITDVATVQIPSDSKSTTINNRATPILEAQAIAIQSADLDIVSGATYTSRTYATSLQSALDKAAAAAT